MKVEIQKPDNRKRMLGTRIHPDTYDRLHDIARKYDISLNELMVQTIDNLIAQHANKEG